ncbi:M13 family metallopeptidase [Woodsholea maritima]|uniref:M13 family metallopeptidase n=1 Tax=Woodsholea maritima TaxID=240237 RepID=UPI00039FFEF7|nr:M13 family metallopeptidase [Woodsholea maritima]
MKRILLSTSALILAAAAAPAFAAQASAQSHAEHSADAPVYGSWGFDIEGMDRSIDPGDNFFMYANKNWLESTQIPSDRSNYGMFTVLADEAEDQVQAIITDAAAENAATGTNAQLVGDLYASWMNADAIEAAGLAPAQPYLDQINAASSHDDIAALFATVHFASPFGAGPIPDPADTTRYTVYVGQGGLGMPDRDYYLEEGEAQDGYRAAYLAYIEQLLNLGGFENAAEKAQAIMAFETRIAEVHWTQEDSRDIQKIYNMMPTADVIALAPAFNLEAGLAALRLDSVDQFLVAQPSAISGASEVFADTDVDTLKAYLAFHFLSDNASALPKAFDDASFNFFSKTLNGTEEQRPREKRGVNLVGSVLGHAVGQIYVQRHFPESSKEQMDGLVQNLITAFEGRLENLSWMDDETRERALHKLSTFEPRIGYPEIWDDYTGLEISADNYFANQMHIAQFQWDQQIEDLGGPVDRREWDWPPQIVNASYNPLMNQITFPAGILQAPFFDPNADPAINYGGIGAVIGHEIGHGFDDQGRRFDYDGSIRDWWTEETNQAFIERSDALVAQYDAYEPLPGEHVNGRFTLGENIGDLGGLQMAYTAYRHYVEENYPGGEAPVLDGLTGDQRFFLGWAQVWRRLYREDNLRSRLSTDPHSPSEYRANVVRNLDAWYAAFDVQEDDALYLPPEQRVKIW